MAVAGKETLRGIQRGGFVMCVQRMFRPLCCKLGFFCLAAAGASDLVFCGVGCFWCNILYGTNKFPPFDFWPRPPSLCADYGVGNPQKCLNQNEQQSKLP